VNVGARPATDGDAEAVTAIADAIRQELAPLRGGAVLLAQQPCRTSPAADGATVGGDVAVSNFVGTIDEVVVGFASVAIERLHDGSRLGVIDGLGVLMDARGVGVGEAMLDEVVAFCRREHCRGIDSYALPGTRETKNFFETFGFTARLLVVHSSLLDDPEPSAELPEPAATP
jgi:ribosomal protein S18 acetylase RimI-like enzyme